MARILFRVLPFTLVLTVLSCSLNTIGDKPTENVSLLFTGDVMLDRGVRLKIESLGIEKIFDKVIKLFKNADYSIINLECPVTRSGDSLPKKYSFRIDPEWIESFKSIGITHCNLANNHSYDRGAGGLQNTIKTLRNESVIPFGYGESKVDACHPEMIHNGDSKIALFASVILPLKAQFPEKGLQVSTCSIKKMCKKIKAFRKKNPGYFVVVNLHWGVEYIQFPTAVQRAQAKALIKAGADAIIGHHPHIIQEIEIIDDKPVFYSLGNFVFDQKGRLKNMGLAVEFVLEDSKLSRAYLHPIKIENRVPRIMNRKETQKLLKEINKISIGLTLVDCRHKWELVI